jgi:hypothetical protein
MTNPLTNILAEDRVQRITNSFETETELERVCKYTVQLQATTECHVE